MGEGVEGEVGGGCGAIDLISASGECILIYVCTIKCYESLILSVTIILQTFLELFCTVFNCLLNIQRLFMHQKTCFLCTFLN